MHAPLQIRLIHSLDSVYFLSKILNRRDLLRVIQGPFRVEEFSFLLRLEETRGLWEGLKCRFRTHLMHLRGALDDIFPVWLVCCVCSTPFLLSRFLSVFVRVYYIFAIF